MFIIFIAFVYQGVCHAVCGGQRTVCGSLSLLPLCPVCGLNSRCRGWHFLQLIHLKALKSPFFFYTFKKIWKHEGCLNDSFGKSRALRPIDAFTSALYFHTAVPWITTTVSPQCTQLNPKLTTTWALCVGSWSAENKPKQHDSAAHGPSRGLLLGWERPHLTAVASRSLLRDLAMISEISPTEKFFNYFTPNFLDHILKEKFPSILFINLDWRKAHISFIVGITDSY